MPLNAAESNRVDLLIAEESSWAASASAGSLAMTQLRLTGEGLAPTKQTVQSNELRSDRMRGRLTQVGQDASGPLNFELSFGGALEMLFEGALANAIASTVISNASISLTSTSVLFPAAVSTQVAQFQVGQFISIGRAGVFRIAAKGTDSLTLEASAIASTGVVSTTVTGRHLRNGTTKKSYIVEKGFEDLANTFLRATGLRIDAMSLTARTGQQVTGSFTVTGEKVAPAASTLASAITSATTTDVMNATGNVPTIFEGGFASGSSAVVTNLSINLRNNTRQQRGLGSLYPRGIGLGSIDLSGSVEVYFEDTTLFSKFVNHTATSLAFPFKDDAGNTMVFQIPRLKFSTGPLSAAGLNQDVMLSLDWTAEPDPTTNTVIMIDFLPPT
jgi:hypothetical protein